MAEPSDEVEVKYGRDAKLEEDANKLLRGSVKGNDRGIARDIEKMSYESGRLSADELQHYDPSCYWKTTDSVFSIAIDPADVADLEPTICADMDDGNIRSRNPKMLERRALMRHVEDSASWGSSREEEPPPLGDNGDHPRKVCTKCKRSKRVEFFYAHPNTRDGLQSWCMACQKS